MVCSMVFHWLQPIPMRFPLYLQNVSASGHCRLICWKPPVLSCRDANVAVELGVHCSVGSSDETCGLKELLYMEKNMIWLKKTYDLWNMWVWHGICMKDVALMICFPCVRDLGSSDASSQLRRHSEELARIRHERTALVASSKITELRWT